ncbi:hypothetical protein D9T14_11775 [Propionibacterium australiense]|nr:hypothetical protein D9T14_11775 [Propionibacterium australiense]RLP10755.1 hypothetical protein D7U36_05570 [Propionibacterium australiense]
MITICAGNVLLFALAGLALAIPFTHVEPIGDVGFSFTPSPFPFLLAGYLVVYPTLYRTLSHRLDWGTASELTAADEREQGIVGRATRASHTTFIAGLIIVAAALFALHVLELFTHATMHLYEASIIMISTLLVIATVVYAVTWVIDYRR